MLFASYALATAYAAAAAAAGAAAVAAVQQVRSLSVCRLRSSLWSGSEGRCQEGPPSLSALTPEEPRRGVCVRGPRQGLPALFGLSSRWEHRKDYQTAFRRRMGWALRLASPQCSSYGRVWGGGVCIGVEGTQVTSESQDFIKFGYWLLEFARELADRGSPKAINPVPSPDFVSFTGPSPASGTFGVHLGEVSSDPFYT